MEETSRRTIIRMRGIYKRFYIGAPNELEILHGIDLDVQEGEFLSIVGPSGSGKSTLMNVIGVLDRPTEGTYDLDGTVVSQARDDELSSIRNRKIGFVFQNFNLISRTNAQKNVELPMMYAGVPAGKRSARAKELLEIVNIQSPVTVEMREGTADITLNLIVRFGTCVPVMAEKVQKNVKNAVQNMTRVTVSRVNLIIAGLAAEQADAAAE